MSTLQFMPPESVITGWDFSTGAVKCLAFDINGNVLASSRFPTDLTYGDSIDDPGAIELNLLQLEGQARATTRDIVNQLRDLGRLNDWAGGGISATHHTCGRIDQNNNQVRRAICWNDQTLAKYCQLGTERLGGVEKVKELIGGPWAVRYSLSHLVKDEQTLSKDDWIRTRRLATHGVLAAGYLTGKFDVISVSSAASTGMMDFRTKEWRKGMLDAIENPEYRALAWFALPEIIDQYTPVGRISKSLAIECKLPQNMLRPFIFPTSDDQQAGLIGGGAVEAGQMAIILGNSAVVNSSCSTIPADDVNLDVMSLNWGPYLLMRCYSNGAYFIDRVMGKNVDYAQLEAAANTVVPGCSGAAIDPFIVSEPSIGITEPRLQWIGAEPQEIGVRYRACLEALAYLIALGVEEHKRAGQEINQITISGGTSKSLLMCKILASVLNMPLKRLVSSEGPALGAAVTALAALENYRRSQATMSRTAADGAFPYAPTSGLMEQYTPSDAVKQMVQFKDVVEPVSEWIPAYQTGLNAFKERLGIRQ